MAIAPLGLLEVDAWVVRVRGRGNEWAYVLKFADADELFNEGAKDVLKKIFSKGKVTPFDLLKIFKYKKMLSEYERDRKLLVKMFALKHGVCPTDEKKAVSDILEWIRSYGEYVYEDSPVIDLLLKAANAIGQYSAVAGMFRDSQRDVLEAYRKGFPWTLIMNPTTAANLDAYGPPENTRFK